MHYRLRVTDHREMSSEQMFAPGKMPEIRREIRVLGRDHGRDFLKSSVTLQQISSTRTGPDKVLVWKGADLLKKFHVPATKRKFRYWVNAVRRTRNPRG